MTNIDKLRYACQNDARIHVIVDALRHEIEDLQLTPAEVREIAMLACIMVEERRPPGPVHVLTAEEYERLYGKKPSRGMFEDSLFASDRKEQP
jgi:hypothetical protein